jgi:hypothetical protein
MSEPIANHSDESPEVEIQRDAETEVIYETFGLPRQAAEKKDIQFPMMDEPVQTDEEQTLTTEEDSKTDDAGSKRTFKVKYLGEDKDVDEDEAPTWIQKGMNHDRLQEKLTEQQKALDEVAKMQGYKDHADLIANLPKLREQQEQKEKERLQKQADDFDALKQQVVQELIDYGVDEQKAKEYAENNPLVKHARTALQDLESKQQQSKAEAEAAQIQQKWAELFREYPDLLESAKGEETPAWLTPDMDRRIKSGYDPIDAYRLAHSDKLQAQSKKAAEQKIIKEQHLGLRGHINEQTATPPNEESLTPTQMTLAEEFGVDMKGVQRQKQLLKSRR